MRKKKEREREVEKRTFYFKRLFLSRAALNKLRFYRRVFTRETGRVY